MNKKNCAFVVLFLMTMTSMASASCIEDASGSPFEYKVAGYYENFDVIFSGKVKKAQDTDRFCRLATFEVLESYKGNVGEEIQVAGSENGCDLDDFRFRENMEYLVYATKYKDYYYTNACTPTKKLEDAAEDLKTLNEILTIPGWKPKPFKTPWGSEYRDGKLIQGTSSPDDVLLGEVLEKERVTETYRDSDLVFSGKVKKVEKSDKFCRYTTFQILETYKGDAKGEIKITCIGEEVRFTENVDYLVYAQEENEASSLFHCLQQNEHQFHACGGWKLEERKDDLKVLTDLRASRNSALPAEEGTDLNKHIEKGK